MLELSGIIILGILAQWVAWKFKIPAILPLILIGLLVGPIAAEFLSEDGTKWIEPVWNEAQGKGLFPGEGLYYFVSLAISIILFEGGLTLKMSEIKNVGPVITKLITLGSLVTFFAAAFAVNYCFGLEWELAFLFSALIIVTGPTVITPILRNIPLKRDVSAVLKWEGILIDPIGALVAVLVFEFIFVGGGGGFTKTALVEFGKIILFGSTFGFAFAHALDFLINKKLIPHYLMNVFALAAVLGVFVLSDSFAHESGLLSVVIMGMVLGNKNAPYLKELLYFKESLSVLLISVLFILLSANIDMDNLMLLANWKTLALFSIVVFIIRPLGVFLSTYKSSLKLNEKLFISWVGPRGIVAAGIASLFGSKLMAENVVGAEYITPLVFMIVLGTVLLNATTARLFAKISGVFLTKSEGILIIGASKVSRLVAQYLIDNGRHVVLVDSNPDNVKAAQLEGIEAHTENIYSDTLKDNVEFNDIGYLIALTGNAEINRYAVEKFSTQFGENGSFRLASKSELENGALSNENGFFTMSDDFNNLMDVIEDYPDIQEISVKDLESYNTALDNIKANKAQVPLFLKTSKNVIHVIPSLDDDVEKEIDAKSKLVYLGQKLEVVN
ncbi:sodium:proton antiporter [Winogradskyella sp.]|jgi:NhaP-type Na+/H+ or K+/H+ antiporter|uniref:cation:proton antiporter n=1 Tax=Winogradskyella sp. TaxID=1883156 RepID=UPI0025E9779C|nr:sodium:proton antiporter [Winogradskyella sp.]MCT4629345.1 cation:proton antiporter [Winogradskyella sp.]